MKNPQIKDLASKTAKKIKSLSEAHESQIKAVYREFREQAAILQGDNAEKLHNPNVTPDQPTAASDQQEREHYG